MRYIITSLLTAIPGLAQAEVPAVVTDIPPVHALVAQVMGDLGQPTLLLAKGADEHDFQLRPSQAGAVADADLVVWIGPELTPWLDSALAGRPEGAAALALLHAEGTALRAYATPTEDGGTDEHDEHAHDAHADEAAHDGHDHGAEDPHAWLDPDNARSWLGTIAGELSRLDPANAATYAGNARAAADRITATDAEIAALLAPAKGKPIVTFHDAFGYFADHYGLTLAGSIALGDATSPGAARLRDLRSDMAGGAVLCIFPEVQHDPALVSQMAEGTDARIGAALDPVGSSMEPGPEAYEAMLKAIGTAIADCVTRPA